MRLLLWICVVLCCLARSSRAQEAPRLILAHYLPWYGSKEVSGAWNWHWTMNHFDPDKVGEDGRAEVASRFSPLIGLYDSSDPDALRCHVMLMKLAGMDGVIFDWYGNDNFWDYAQLNANTLRLIPFLEQAHLGFALCYEDQSLRHEVENGFLKKEDRVSHGQNLFRWMNAHIFARPSYVRLDGRPLLLSFGEPVFSDDEWNALFSVLPQKPIFLTESVLRAKTAASGAYDWPIPSGGAEGAARETDAFYDRTATWSEFIPMAFPRFEDVYALAGAGRSWGHVSDDGGRRFEDALRRALGSKARVVQLVTWNDWGEGTQIEPSREFGFRDLETIQRLRRQWLDARFEVSAAALRLPIQWYRTKKRLSANAQASAQLDRVFELVVQGRWRQGQALLQRVEQNAKER